MFLTLLLSVFVYAAWCVFQYTLYGPPFDISWIIQVPDHMYLRFIVLILRYAMFGLVDSVQILFQYPSFWVAFLAVGFVVYKVDGGK